MIMLFIRYVTCFILTVDNAVCISFIKSIGVIRINITFCNNSYYNRGYTSNSGDSISAKYKISDSFIIDYNTKTLGTLTWSDLVTIQVNYDADTKQIDVSIVGYNDNFQDVIYLDKKIYVDPTRPTVTRID